MSRFVLYHFRSVVIYFNLETRIVVDSQLVKLAVKKHEGGRKERKKERRKKRRKKFLSSPFLEIEIKLFSLLLEME